MYIDGITLIFFSLSFWFFKFLVLVGITVGAFFIPDGDFNTGMVLATVRTVLIKFELES